MEDRETARMRKCGESKTTRIMMTTVPHVTSGLGLWKFQADGIFVDTSVHTHTYTLARTRSHPDLGSSSRYGDSGVLYITKTCRSLL